MPKAATHLTVLQGVSSFRRDCNSPRFRLLRKSSREAVAFLADSEQPTHSVLAPEKTRIRNASLLDRARNHMRTTRRHLARDSIALVARRHRCDRSVLIHSLLGAPLMTPKSVQLSPTSTLSRFSKSLKLCSEIIKSPEIKHGSLGRTDTLQGAKKCYERSTVS